MDNSSNGSESAALIQKRRCIESYSGSAFTSRKYPLVRAPSRRWGSSPANLDDFRMHRAGVANPFFVWRRAQCGSSSVLHRSVFRRPRDYVSFPRSGAARNFSDRRKTVWRSPSNKVVRLSGVLHLAGAFSGNKQSFRRRDPCVRPVLKSEVPSTYTLRTHGVISSSSAALAQMCVDQFEQFVVHRFGLCFLRCQRLWRV